MSIQHDIINIDNLSNAKFRRWFGDFIPMNIYAENRYTPYMGILICQLPRDKVRVYMSFWGDTDQPIYTETSAVYSQYDNRLIEMKTYLAKYIEDLRVKQQAEDDKIREREELLLVDKMRNVTTLDSFIGDDNVINIINLFLGDELLKSCNICGKFVENYKLLNNYNNDIIGCFECKKEIELDKTCWNDKIERTCYKEKLVHCPECRKYKPRASFVTDCDINESPIMKCESCCAVHFNYIIEINKYISRYKWINYLDFDFDLPNDPEKTRQQHIRLNRKYADKFSNDRFRNLTKKDIKSSILRNYGIRIKYFGKTKVDDVKEYLRGKFYDTQLLGLKENCDNVDTIYVYTI